MEPAENFISSCTHKICTADGRCDCCGNLPSKSLVLGHYKEWKSPSDEDARIAKMKDGRTHLAHKAEHAVDLDTGAVVAVTLQGADQGDTTTLDTTLSEAGMAVAEQIGREAEQRPEDKPKVNVNGIEEVVADKGYHSGAVLERVKGDKVRSYIPEKQQKGRRKWQGKRAEQQAVYQNRGRVQGEYGYCGGAANWWNAALRIATTRVA